MPTERQVSWLLEELCTELGLCLPPAGGAHPRRLPPVDADEFTTAVFRLEDFEPAEDRRLYADVRRRVERIYSRSEDGAG